MMRVAFVGKGGAGKSAIAGTFCRVLARRGEPVLAIDVDHVPGLALSLGLQVSDTPIPDEAVEERPVEEIGSSRRGLPYRLRAGLTGIEAVERYAAVAPDGVRFLEFCKLSKCVDFATLMRPLCAFRQILEEVPNGPWNLVGDLPAGTMLAGMADYADTVVVVVEPTAKSLLSGRRLARLAHGPRAPRRMVAVASKIREPSDVDLVRRSTGLPVVAAVPWDEQLAEAECLGLAPIDHAPGSQAVRAVESMLDRLTLDKVA